MNRGLCADEQVALLFRAIAQASHHEAPMLFKTFYGHPEAYLHPVSDPLILESFQIPQ